MVVRDTLRSILGTSLCSGHCACRGRHDAYRHGVVQQAFNDAWWFAVLGGILEVFIGFWVSAQSFRAQAFFLIIWAGLLALFRGVFEIMLAFEMRSAQTQLERPDPGRSPANR